MANFDHSRPIDLRKSKQTHQKIVYSKEIWMPELIAFDIVSDPGFSNAMMSNVIVKDPSRIITLDF